MKVRALGVMAVLMLAPLGPGWAADLQTFAKAKLVDDPGNDGDSFMVDANGKTFRVRLYFVDCPETTAGASGDTQRVREQMRYFGLPDAKRTVQFGDEAKAFVDRRLAQPFTVHTAFASALGRSAKGRVYAFVTTADGTDLASQLVKNGLARAMGVGRQTPEGVSRDEMSARIRDYESSAMLKRVGIWAESDPDRIAELRARQRTEDQELKDLQDQIPKPPPTVKVVDLNTATEKELQSLKGIGPVLAREIIADRPYSTVEDLRKVKGIGPEIFETIRPYLAVGKE